MRLLRGLALLLACLFAPLTATQAKDVVVVALQLEPPNLDPTSGAATAIDEVTYANIFEGLVRLSPDGTPRPWLATGWTVAADGLSYVFRLRPGVRFHDGTPLTAADVVFSLRRAGAPGSSNAQAPAFAAMSAVALDPLTVRIDLKTRNADLLTLISYGDAVIVSLHSAARLATAPVGTGPFRFARWRRGDALTLTRNADYWGPPARLAGVTFRFIADPNAAYAAVKAHDVDLFPDFPAPETLDELRRDPNLKIVVAPSQGEVILALNQRTGPLASLAVRQAIGHALDRRAIIEGGMFGYGTPIGSHFPVQSPDYVDLTGRYPYDPAAARRLLATAGYPNGFDLTLKLPPQAYARRTGEIIVAQLRAVGIRVTTQNLEWAQWLDEVFARHAFDMTIVNHAEPFDYDIYGRDDYYFGYRSSAVRALLAELRQSSDPGVRRSVLEALQRRIADDAVNGYLFQFPHLGVVNATLGDAWANTPNEIVNLATAHFDGGGATGREAVTDGAGGWGGIAAAAIALALLAAAAVRFGPLFVAGRVGVLAATLLVATLVIFVLIQVVPGDPAAYMMGLNASPQAIAALHVELGLGGPAPMRYLAWLGGLVRGDFGISYTYRVPVAGLLGERLSVSLPLAGIATLGSILLGVPAGYLAARRRGSIVDGALAWAARLGIALPSFWLAILLVLLFSVKLQWFAAGGFPGWEGGWGPALRALLLPSVALAVPQAAILARVTRAALLETLAEDYMRTARAKGLGADAALRRHGLPNALGPVLTVLGLQVPFLLAGSAIIENIFFLPGLGRLVLQAIAQRDLIVVQAIVVLLVAVTVGSSFAIDLAAAAIDPRRRAA